MTKLFFHVCCAPCTVYPFFKLQEEGFEVTGFFYNPNIHPYQEYQRRLDTVHEFASRAGLEMVYRDGYDLDEFLRAIVGTGKKRCEHCYRFRLRAAASAAQARGFSRFSTSLLYSKQQNHDLISAIGRESASEAGIEFYYEDFRKGWREGIMESKAMGLYRQQYCGCIYSEGERYGRK